MSRPCIPTEVLEAKGAFIAHPERKRNKEMRSRPLGSPFSTLTADELAIWNDIVELTPPGVLKSTDRYALRTMCRLLVKESSGGLSVGELSQLRSLYGEFGFTPSSRAKVEVSEDNENRLASFLNRTKPC